MERKQQAYQLREINDQEEVKLTEKKYEELRAKEDETLGIKQASIQKEIDMIHARKKKAIAEIKEQTSNMINKIDADGELTEN